MSGRRWARGCGVGVDYGVDDCGERTAQVEWALACKRLVEDATEGHRCRSQGVDLGRVCGDLLGGGVRKGAEELAGGSLGDGLGIGVIAGGFGENRSREYARGLRRR